MRKVYVSLFAIVCLSSLVTLAADPIGAPRAGVGQGKFGLSLEHSYAKLTLMRELFGESDRYDIDQMQTSYLTGSYGLANWLELFLRVGIVDVNSSDESLDRVGPGPRRLITNEYDYDTDFIYGGGARVTFGSTGNVTFGAVASYSWTEMDGQFSRSYSYYSSKVDANDADMEMKMQQAQLAIGATWNPAEHIAVYGGGLVHYVRIEEDRTWQRGGPHHSDHVVIKNDDGGSMLGGYAGVEIGLTENLTLSLEGSYTGDSKGGSASLGWEF